MLGLSNGMDGGPARGDNAISDISPLANMNRLEGLYLADNKVVDVSPLTNLENLRMLDLEYNLISQAQPLNALSELESLFLTCNPITDADSLSDFVLAYVDPYNNPSDAKSAERCRKESIQRIQDSYPEEIREYLN